MGVMAKPKGIAELERMDPEQRLTAATHEIIQAELMVDAYRAVRDVALLALAGDGWGYQRIGNLLGVSKARSQQLVMGARRRLNGDI